MNKYNFGIADNDFAVARLDLGFFIPTGTKFYRP